jgi:hypothetical protein
MKLRTYEMMVAALDRVIENENNDREGYVYGNLVHDMAKAAELVYDSCLKGQSYAKDGTEVTTS